MRDRIGTLRNLPRLFGLVWRASPALALLVLAEAALGILSDLLGQRYSDSASLRLMRHAATLDLEQFESSDQQDRLDRARLSRVVIDPQQPLSFKREKDTDFRDTVTTWRSTSGR